MTTTVDVDTLSRVRRLQRRANQQGLTLTKKGNVYTLAEATARGTRFVRSAGVYRLDAIEEEVSKTPQVLPPDFVADDGTVVKTLVFDPFWLYVAAHSGVVIVYRSVLIDDDSQLYWPALDVVEGLPLIHCEVIEDDGMMHGRAELAIYEAVAA